MIGADRYSRTFHPNWIGIAGATAVLALLAAVAIVAWKRRKVGQP